MEAAAFVAQTRVIKNLPIYIMKNHYKQEVFCGKKGIIIRQVDPNDVIIEDNIYNSKFVYEIYVPLHGSILALDAFMHLTTE